MDELTTRFLSACVASTVATIATTPFDVVKTRLQVVATSSASSWVPIRASNDAFEYQCLAMQTAQKGSFVHNSHLVQLSHVAHHPATFSSLMAMCPNVEAAATRGSLGLTATLKKILKEEGVRSLWRGLDTAMLLNIPMISVYMVLYDTLHSQLSKDMGAYAPAVAGMVARTGTVLATAPLELVRTRQQASSGAARTMGSLLTSWQGTAGSSSSSSSSGVKGLRARLAGVQSLWTGVGATLARDVPFTVLYWCVVEPTRAHLLKARQRTPTDVGINSSSSSSSSGGAGGNSSSCNLESPSLSPQAAECQDSCQPFPGGASLQHQQVQQLPPPASSSLNAEGTISPMLFPDAALPLSSDPPTVSQPVSVQQVLVANLTAGSIAGGLAAALTTPFDVLKTRLQTKRDTSAAGQPSCCMRNSSRPAATGGVDTLMHIWRTEGMQGLFAGVVPRAARAVPACAIVLSTYEVLKLLSE